MSEFDATIELEHIRANVFFACFEKHESPLVNVLAACKRGALPTADLPFDTLIVPGALPDIYNNARPEGRHFYLNGTAASQLEPIRFDLNGGMFDAPTGLNIFATHAKPSYVSGGTLRPRMTENALYRRRTIALWYPNDAEEVMDFVTGEWVPRGAGENVRLVTLLMSSAILGKSGSDTGEMLMAYPLSSVHTIETSPEMLKMQLRTHLGCALYKPENVMTIPDCHAEGIVEQSGLLTGGAIDDNGKIKVLNFGGAPANNRGDKLDVVDISGQRLPQSMQGKDMPRIAYRGSYRKAGGATGKTVIRGNGHLGWLDSTPRGVSKLKGHNVFQRHAAPVTVE